MLANLERERSLLLGMRGKREKKIPPVVNVSAEMRINVVDIKLAIARPVESPGTVVADHLLPSLRDLSGHSGWFGRISGSVGCS